MKKAQELQSHEVLREAQGLIYDLAGKMLDYLEPSEAKASQVARGLGIDVEFDSGVVYLSNPGLDVYAVIDGHDFDRQAFRPAFTELVGKVRRGEAVEECDLDVSIERLSEDTVKVTSHSMCYDAPVKRENLEETLSGLCKEWGNHRLAQGDGEIIKVVREVSDPEGVLARAVDLGPSDQAPAI